MVKLTEAQRGMLTNFASWSDGRPLHVAKSARLATVRRLIKRRLIEKTDRPPVGDFHFYRITESGRAALIKAYDPDGPEMVRATPQTFKRLTLKKSDAALTKEGK